MVRKLLVFKFSEYLLIKLKLLKFAFTGSSKRFPTKQQTVSPSIHNIFLIRTLLWKLSEKVASTISSQAIVQLKVCICLKTLGRGKVYIQKKGTDRAVCTICVQNII